MKGDGPGEKSPLKQMSTPEGDQQRHRAITAAREKNCCLYVPPGRNLWQIVTNGGQADQIILLLLRGNQILHSHNARCTIAKLKETVV